MVSDIKIKGERRMIKKLGIIGMANDIQLLCMAMILMSSVRILEAGFTWIGLGGFICGVLLILMASYMKNFDLNLNETKVKGKTK